MYSIGLPGMSLVKEDAPNPQKTGDPRSREVWSSGGEGGDILVEMKAGEDVWDVEQSEGGPGGG